MRSDSGVLAGTSLRLDQTFWRGSPSTKSQTRSARSPPLLPQGEHGPGVADGGLHLEPVADDAGVGQEPRDVPRVEAGDLFRIEPREGPPIAFALAQDGEPGEAGLGPLEGQHLEEMALVSVGDAPLPVVVGEIERVATTPGAADDHRVPRAGAHSTSSRTPASSAS